MLIGDLYSRNGPFTAGPVKSVMREFQEPLPERAALLLLESAATRAGSAMACAFASSDEFEAAVLRRTLHRALSHRSRRWRFILAAGAVTVLVAALLWLG